MKIKSILAAGLVSLALAVSLHAKKDKKNTAAADSEMKAFTVGELAKYTGKKGEKAYVAIDGVVYDVTDVAAWKNGKHKMGLTAGKDLSDKISKSPHGKSVLGKLKKIGVLKKGGKK